MPADYFLQVSLSKNQLVSNQLVGQHEANQSSSTSVLAITATKARNEGQLQD